MSAGIRLRSEVGRLLSWVDLGRSRGEVLVFDDALIETARAELDQPPSHPRASSFDGKRDPRVRPLMALHRSFLDGASSRDELEETGAHAAR